MCVLEYGEEDEIVEYFVCMQKYAPVPHFEIQVKFCLNTSQREP